MRNILISTLGTSLIGNISYSNDSDLKRLLETKTQKGLLWSFARLVQQCRSIDKI